MGMALVAIVLVFTQSEGCGRRYAFIESISFSSDGSRIAVSKLNARDARTPGKGCKADISRTLSVLASSNGSLDRLLHQDFEPGNRGPAFGLWWVGRTSAVFNPMNDHVVAVDFDGGNLTQYDPDRRTKPIVTQLPNPATNISLSKSGRLIAVSSWDELSIYETTTGKSVMRVQGDDFFLPFLGAALLAFSEDETRIVMASVAGIRVWEVASGTRSSTVVQGSEPGIRTIAIAPDDTVLVCSDAGVRRYDFSGNLVSTLADSKGCYAVCISKDGQNAALIDDGSVVVYGLESGAIVNSVRFNSATTLAFSPDGYALAVGDGDGRVSLIDVRTGNCQWSSSPPGRYRCPWTLPACFLAVWGYIAWRLSQNARTDGNDSKLTSSGRMQ